MSCIRTERIVFPGELFVGAAGGGVLSLLMKPDLSLASELSSTVEPLTVTETSTNAIAQIFKWVPVRRCSGVRRRGRLLIAEKRFVLRIHVQSTGHGTSLALPVTSMRSSGLMAAAISRAAQSGNRSFRIQWGHHV